MTETNFTSDTLKEIKVRNIYDKSLINFRFPSSAKVSARTSQRRTKSTLGRGCSVQAARETAAARYKGFMNGCKDFTWDDFHSLKTIGDVMQPILAEYKAFKQKLVKHFRFDSFATVTMFGK